MVGAQWREAEDNHSCTIKFPIDLSGMFRHCTDGMNLLVTHHPGNTYIVLNTFGFHRWSHAPPVSSRPDSLLFDPLYSFGINRLNARLVTNYCLALANAGGCNLIVAKSTINNIGFPTRTFAKVASDIVGTT